MENRLRRYGQTTIALFCLILALIPATSNAQLAFFDFQYSGPSTIAVGPTCSATLAGNVPPPIVTSTIGANIVVSVFDSITAGYKWTDIIPAPPGIPQVIPWYVADDQGHSQSYQFVITLVDVTPPVFDLTGVDPVIVTNSIVQVPPAPTIPVSDNCSPTNKIMRTFVQTTPPPICAGGSFTRTWTATDEANNTAIFTQFITVWADTLPPQITFPPQNGSAPCEQLATAYPAWLNAQMAAFTASDASGVASYTNNAPLPFPPGCATPRTITFRATDNCGLQVSTTAVFTTSDNKPPVLVNAPRDSIAACSPSGPPLAALGHWINQRAFLQVFDSCTVPNLLTYFFQINGTIVDSAGIAAAFQNSFAGGCNTQLIGNQNVQKVRALVRVDFFSRDACGNTALAGRATFAAIDTLRPVITGVNITEQCGGGDDQTNLNQWINLYGNAQVTDECSQTTWTNFSWTTSTGQNGAGVFNSGPYPAIPTNDCNWFVDVTFRASDQCGNIGARTLRFSLRDTIAPAFQNLAPAVTLYCPATLPLTPAAQITDHCDTTFLIASARQLVDSLCSGHYDIQVTWSATDDCGNTGTAVQLFEIRDTTGPVFTLIPPEKTIRCDTFAPPPPPLYGVELKAVDACGGAVTFSFQETSTQNPNPVVCGHYTYAINRVFTATDDCGNTRTATQRFNVIDNLPPVFSGFTDTTTFICDLALIVMPPPTAADACSGPAAPPVLVGETITGGACFDSYTRTLTWQAVDVCGNTGLFSQNIHVLDTTAPTLSGVPADVIVECTDIPGPPAPGVVVGADDCDEAVEISFLEAEIRNPDLNSCDHWANYMIQRQWTVSDNCGNTRAYTQNIQVQDNTGPLILSAAPVLLPNDPGDCGAAVTIPGLVSLFDECSSLQQAIVLRDTTLFANTSGLPNNTTPVDTAVFQWSAPNLPPLMPAISAGLLTIVVEKADSESPSETFKILGENGVVLGQTNTLPQQCTGSSTTAVPVSAFQLNSWLTDGQLEIRLAPNGSGANACNMVCPGARALATLSYPVAQQQIPIQVTFSLDGGAPAPYPPPSALFLSKGVHTVTYIAEDCAGNTSTASVNITVEDIEPPAVSAASQLTAYVGANNCVADVLLPFPNISENCGLSGSLNLGSAVEPLVFEFDPNAQFVPKDVDLGIVGLIPNAVTGGALKIYHRGDFADPGEFFSVLDENNMFISATATPGNNAGECQSGFENVTTIPVSAAQINAWGADGVAGFRLEANRDAGAFTQFIGPCGPLAPDFTDGLSRVRAELTYNFAVVLYEIRRGTTLIKNGALTGGQTSVQLTPGVYTVRYRVSDGSGIEGSTTFTLTVRDTVAPKALCQPLTIFTNPSGAVNYILQPQEIDAGSTDNCTANPMMLVSPNTFSCNQVSATPYSVTLTVRDSSNNVSTCTTLVRVETANLQPTYTPVCEGGALQLMANAPPPTNVYTYNWVGPGFGSIQPNPSIPNAQLNNEGPYTVTATGLTGCTATGVVQVDLVNLPTQPVLNTNGPVVCQGNNIVLSTPTYSGSNVLYQWFAGDPLNPVPLGNTLLPAFTINQPLPGNYEFFVKVAADGCSSLSSEVTGVTVQVRPVASVWQPQIAVCPGEAIVLGTDVFQPGMTYSWTGPNGYVSSSQIPPSIPSAAEIHEGTYTLVVNLNNCPSAPVTASVNVQEKPPTPSIVGSSNVCAGDTLLLASSANGASWQWQPPSGPIITTPINLLLVPAVTAADSGLWRVRVFTQNCYSDWSAPKVVKVEPYPDVTAFSNAPLCQGANLQLSAQASPATGVAYQWSGPGFMQFAQSPVIMNPLAGTYQVIVTTPIGCRDSASVQVQIVAPPLITSVTNTAPQCASGQTSAVLQAVVTSDNHPLQYIWTGPNGSFFSSLPFPVIPTITSANNGPYTLVVTDVYGCTSTPATTTVAVQDIPPTPVIAPAVSICEGGNLTLTLQNASIYTGGGYTFRWNTPTGVQDTNRAVLFLPAATTQNSGIYTVQVIQGECESQLSVPVEVAISPIPAPPSVTANSPLCVGQTLQLSTEAIPGATYEWFGPGGFTAMTANATRLNIQTTQSGLYFVRLTLNGCTSPLSDGKFVEVKTPPAAPAVLPLSQSVCLDAPGAVISLNVNPVTGTPGAQYQWFDSQNLPLGPPSFGLNFQISDLSGFTPGTYQFSVRAILDVCQSALAQPPATVILDEIPDNTAFAGPDFTACFAQPLALSATTPTAGTGLWTTLGGAGGLTIVNPASPTSQVTGIQPDNTYRFVWSLSNGACKNYSRDTIQVQVVAPEQAVSVALIDTCAATGARLGATQGTGANGQWSQLPSQGPAGLGVTITNPADPNTTVTGLIPGNTYFFYWTLPNIGCGSTTDTTMVRVFRVNPYAGPDQYICSNDSCTTLSAAQAPNEQGRWSTPDCPNCVISDPNLGTTSVCGLRRGVNTFVWTTNGGFCGPASRDTVRVNYELFPTANTDTVVVPFGTRTNINVLLNDILPQQYDVVVTKAPLQGQFSTVAVGQYSYQPAISFTGEDEFFYKVCNLVQCGGDGDSCSTARVVLLVQEPGDCIIPTVITPNNDQVNDIFFIPCLYTGPGATNAVTIFNQWGDQVFHAEPYNNDWDGAFNGAPLPAGTYFFVVKLNNEEAVRTGFLLIQR